MVYFDFISKPVELSAVFPTTICIENKQCFRNVVSAFMQNSFEEFDIVFSENYEPVSIKNKMCFISDYYNLTFPSSFFKKLYSDINYFCFNEMQEKTVNLQMCIENYFSEIILNYDFDLECSDDFNIQDLFKMKNLKPYISNENLLTSLIDYILVINKYSKVNLFVLLNFHLYFSKEELKQFFEEMRVRNIVVFLLENVKSFENNACEKIIVIDEDMCEIR